MTYNEFIQLSDFNKLIIKWQIKATRLPDVDCSAWKWGDVKQVQDQLSGDLTFEKILSIVRIEAKMLNEDSDIRLILQFFFAIEQSIESITKIETESMSYQQTTKEVAAAAEVGGFSIFGTYPQTLRLVGVVAPSAREVEEMTYNDCFAALLYVSRLNDFKKIVIKP